MISLKERAQGAREKLWYERTWREKLQWWKEFVVRTESKKRTLPQKSIGINTDSSIEHGYDNTAIGYRCNTFLGCNAGYSYYDDEKGELVTHEPKSN